LPVSARTFAIFMAVLALIGLLAFGLISKGDDPLEPGDPVPEAELPSLDGQSAGSVADYRGDWVLVNVWASWCDPCRDEAPALERFYRTHRDDGLTVLGIDTQDDSASGREFVQEFGLTYPQLHDGSGDYADDLKTTGVPENFLVDPDGKVAVVERAPVTAESLEARFAPMIEAS
jgi:cytochrome c biogenesis protein CcmG/thiol:disulfide interchange protein DsbE